MELVREDGRWARKCLSAGLGRWKTVDIGQAELGQLRAHVVEVEPEFTRGESGANFGFPLFPLLRRVQNGFKLRSPHRDDAVVIGHDRIAREDDASRTNHRDIDGA